MLFEPATKMLRHNKQDTGDRQVPIIDLNLCCKDLYDSLNSMNLLKVHFPLGKTPVRKKYFSRNSLPKVEDIFLKNTKGFTLKWEFETHCVSSHSNAEMP